MSTQLKLRRGTTAQHSTFTGASGEITIDTDKNVVIVHDGSTAGGIPQAKDSSVVHNTGDETISGTKTFSSTIQGSISGSSGSCTGNAATATTATTATSATNASNVPWSGVSSKPTTLSGYGITDAQPSDTAITTSNIGSQSVNYATSAGSVADGSVTAAKMAAGAAVGNIANNTITPAMHSNSGYEFGIRNRIINGSMMIDQRNAGASVTPTTGTYIVDRWRVYASQTSKLTAQQNAGSVTPPVGFTNYLGITSSSAYSVLSGDLFLLQQFVEGFNVSDLAWGTANAQPITISFVVRSSLTGTFGVILQNSAGDRVYPFTYTISSANTWETKSVTIAGDTTGTWLTNNGKGIVVSFGLGVGSTASGTAGSWQSAGYYGVTGATSVVGTNGATFYITGVQLEKGSVATPFEFRPYGQELALCQRYYSMSYSQGQTPAQTNTGATAIWVWTGYPSQTNSNYAGPAIGLPVEMRATPSVTLYSSSTGATGKARAQNQAADLSAQTNGASTRSISLSLSSQTIQTGDFIYFHYAATSEL